MAQDGKNPITLGAHAHQANDARFTAAEIIAAVLSLLWLAMTGTFFFTTGDASSSDDPSGLQTVMIAMAIVMPIALIWFGAIIVRTSQRQRADSQRLHDALAAMQASASPETSKDTSAVLGKRLDEIVAEQRKTQAAFTALNTKLANKDLTPLNSGTATPVQQEEQGTLALGTPIEGTAAQPLPIDDFIQAMNFPETADDRAGFRALHRAMTDRKVGQLIHAAQDILTLLSEDGIYMDDLKPDRAKPEIWRQFAKGERGRAVAALGGVRDQGSLAFATKRLKQDHIFRDAAHHFLRKFDRTFVEFEAFATDEDIVALSNTRTARAFMLLGRVAGTFD